MALFVLVVIGESDYFGFGFSTVLQPRESWKSFNNIGNNQSFWASKNEHRQRTIVLTKIADQQPGSGHFHLRSSRESFSME